MLAGIHFFSASIISLKFSPSLFFSLILGFIIHHLEDLLPHLDLNIFNKKEYESIKNWDFKAWSLFLSEFLFFFLLTFYFLGNFSLEKQKIAFFGGLGALLPDIISFTIKSFFPKFKLLNFYLGFHEKYHFKLKDKNYLLPIILEILLILLCLFLIKSVRH
jgi:hypothetical protein